MKISRKIKNLAMIGVIGLQTLFTAVPVNAVTASDVSFDHNNEREMSVTWKGETRDIWTAPIYLDRGNGKELVFCVDPFSHVLEGTGYSSNPFALNRKANLVSTLWNLAGTDLDTMFVAQEMLYNEVGAVVHSNGDLKEEQRTTIKNKINDVIVNYEKQPSFHNSKVKLTLGESTVLTDTNGSNLSQFDVVAQNTANVDFKQSGNKLTITPKITTDTSGTLILKKSLREGTPFVWKKAGSQDVLSAGVADPSKYKIDFEIVTTGEMKIVKLDKKTGKPVLNTKFEVEYNGKKQTVTTDTKGEAIVKNIPHNAKVKATEIFVPAPYVLDKNNTKEVVVKAGKTASVEFKNEVATGKTTLIKEDKTTNSDKPLNPTYPMVGAKYGLFKENGTLLKEFTLDEKLTASMDKLDLGTYYWQETEAPAGYTLDPEKHVVELTYKDQNTPVVIKDSKSKDDVIRMNLDGQKLIQNDTNEIFKNGVEFTLTNQRTGEIQTETTANVDGKKGYFRFADLAIDDYVITETKGVDGYQNIDPMEIKYSYDEKTDTFTFTVIDQKSGNVLNTEQFTQEELAKGENVDLGTYTLKDKATPTETPIVDIVSQAHIGDGKTQTFTWDDDVKLYDDVKISHKNIAIGTERAFEDTLVAVTPDNKEKDVWTSGKIDYKVTENNTTHRVQSDYDYKKDPKGTRYFFKVVGYSKLSDKEYKKDTEHNFDGKQKNQDLTPEIPEKPEVSISTQAHTGDNKTQTFVWGDLVTQYDDVKISHKNIAVDTERAFETILVAVTPDNKEKDVWSSGKVDYKVSDKETIQTVKADYDYRKDPKGTRYFFKEIGYSKPNDHEYKKDTEHNFDGKEKTQDIIPTIKEEPKKPERGLLPYTGEKGNTLLVGLGFVILGSMYVFIQYKKRKKKQKNKG
ncbi:MSCRAMM family protein [Enterococcus sp. DIV1758]|uniref:MSCRAMM family protein n=1 Tax=Enterococcus sp. DIV1758 TaxID=2774744 RepID=UPI003F274E61